MEARRAFNEDARWRSGPIYIFVSGVTPLSDQAQLFVFPPDRPREGSSLGLVIDTFGHCHVNRVGAQRPAWIPFQAAALALSHTLNASFRNRLNVSLLHK